MLPVMPSIVFITPPFIGHALVLHRAAEILQKNDPHMDLHCIYLTWKNRPIPELLQDSKTIFSSVQSIVNPDELITTNPEIWCEDQRKYSVPILIDIIDEMKDVKTIVYDSFSWVYTDLMISFPEIHFICSLSGFLGPERIMKNQNRSISDSSFQEAPFNIAWTQYNVQNRKTDSNKYHFMGFPTNYALEKLHKSVSSLRILVSLGTVITDPYLWDTNNSVREFVKDLLSRLYDLANTDLSNIEFVFVLPKHIEFKTEECKNIIRFETIDQWKMLSDTPFQVLITHGGNNSVQEALVLRVPMLVIPFFGDQHETAEWIVRNKLGLSIPLANSASTESQKDRKLDNLKNLLEKLLSWTPARFAVTSHLSLSPYALIMQRIPFQMGDILLGCNVDRHKYIQIFERDKQPEQFGFSNNPESGNSSSWKKYRDYPLLLDNYTDMIQGYYSQSGIHADVVHILQLVKLSRPKNIIKTCLTLMDILLKQGKQLHFVIETYLPNYNFFTLVEFAHILRKWNHLIGKQIHFYEMTDSNRLFPINIYHHEFGNKTIDYIRKACYFPEYENVYYRIKTLKSLINNLQRGNRLGIEQDMFHDIIGLRILVKDALPKETIEAVWQNSEIVWSRTDSGFLYAAHMQLNQYTELQIWSVTMYAGLHLEHQTIYKKSGFLTGEEREKSAILWQAQNDRVSKNII